MKPAKLKVISGLLSVITCSVISYGAIAGPLEPNCDPEKIAKNAAAKATIGVSGRCTPEKAAKRKVEDVKDSVGDAKDKVADSVRDKADAVKPNKKEGIDAKNVAKGKVDGVKDTVGNAKDKAADSIRDKADAVKPNEKLTDKTLGAVKFDKKEGIDAKNVAKGKVEGVKNTVDNAKGKATDSVRDTVDAVKPDEKLADKTLDAVNLDKKEGIDTKKVVGKVLN